MTISRPTVLAVLGVVGALLAALLTTASPAAAISPRWHQVHFHMNAYKEAGFGPHGVPLGCHGTWSDDHGTCHGQGEAVHSYPFNTYVNWAWHRKSTNCPDLPHRGHSEWTHELTIRSNAAGWPASELCGWVDRHWGTFAITEGRVYTNAGWHDVRTTSAVVTDREHTQGGPLFVHLGHRTGGYVLGMRGWIHY